MRHSVCYVMVSLFLLGSTGRAYTSGQGTQADPYEIADVNDLLELAGTPGDYASYFFLSADIDMTGAGPFYTAVIAPDTSSDNYFQGPAFNGVFDGGGHVIRNLVIEPNEGNDYIGLFGYAGYYPNSAEIRDLGIENISIVGSSGHKSVGALVGEMYNGDIKRCFTTGSVTLDSDCENVGGLIGYSTSGDVSNSYSQCSVTCGADSDKIGGLIGACYNIQCRYTYSAGPVSAAGGSTSVGGFLGANGMFFTTLANFWDIEASGQDVGIIAEGLQTLQMFSKAPFLEAGWDFDNDWKSPIRSYPMLSWQSYTIGLADLDGFIDAWLTDSTDPNVIYPADFYEDGSIDIKDFGQLSKSWFSGQMLYGFGEIFDGFETGDFSALDWSSEGMVLWQVTSADAYEGTYCAAVQDLPAGQPSQLNLDVEIIEGKIGFYYKNIGSRTIYFLIDEEMVGMLGATSDWSYAEYDITEGPHTCSWMFYNFMGGSEDDIGRIDNVRIYSPD